MTSILFDGFDVDNEWKCILNQTIIKGSSSSNKFYIIAVLKHKHLYYLGKKWGRIGTDGRITIKDFFSKEDAINYFKISFKDKTKNKWGENFVKYKNKYYLSQIDEVDENKDEIEDEIIVSEKKVNNIKSKLSKELYSLIKILTNNKMIMQNIKCVGTKLNIRDTCLGKLKTKQLKEALQILKKISKNINNPSVDFNLENETSEFFTRIPQNVGFGKNKLPLIEGDLLITFIEGLEHLLDINKSQSIINNAKKKEGININIHRYDKLYNDLQCDISLLDSNSKIYTELTKYILNTNSPSHNFETKIVNIYKINRGFGNDELLYKKYCKSIGNYGNNKILLFHGSRTSNWVSILKNNLYLNPAEKIPNIHISGKMFGYGCYFADLHSKSLQYCGIKENGHKDLFLMVAEVCVGNQWKLINAKYNANIDIQNTPYNSVFAQGKYGTFIHNNFLKNNELIIPNDNVKLYENSNEYSLLHNEYIVYDKNSWIFRYMIHIK